LSEDIDGSNDYVAIERIPSHEAYRWMVDYVDEVVAPTDEDAASQLSSALHGKGGVRRFKDAYIASMINGCKHGITGNKRNSKRLSMSG
jgi:predicted nucleic acid-binding protein